MDPLSLLRSLVLHTLASLRQQPSRRPRNPAPEASPMPPHGHARESLYDAWLASRSVSSAKGVLLTPGAQRPLTRENVRLAVAIAKQSSADVLSILWQLHPLRLLLMVSLDLFKGIFPAFRGYSQALIINEFQSLISSGNFMCARLCRLIATELLRVVFESYFDSFATTNEEIVQSSAKFLMEYRQMGQRVRMDVPTMADPHIRDLFQESDLFVRSFSGVANFGLFSPLDLFRILTLVSEIVSHILLLWSLTSSGTHLSLLVFSLGSYFIPLLMTWHGNDPEHLDDYHDGRATRAVAQQNKMRDMANSDVYRSEIVLFGLGPWILETWAKARKATLGIDQPPLRTESHPFSVVLSNVNMTGLLAALQNIPVVLAVQSSATTLGSFTLYRSSVQSIVFTARHLVQQLRMAFQSVFLMGAFSAAMQVQPRLQPRKENTMSYESDGRGMKIEARNLSFTYPGSHEPAVQNVSFTLEAGESLAIVGYNGSGKSTLANILLRVTDFDEGELLVNGRDIRTLDPKDFHQRVTAVFQGFSRFEASVKENVGVGYFPEMRSSCAVHHALDLGGAEHVVSSLPHGLKTHLATSGAPQANAVLPQGAPGCPGRSRHGLSGGEWQRIAISRAFMRAHRPEVDLLLLDEPTSSLDAHAQKRVFETVERISRAPTGERIKSVIFITHRLSTARRADKIAMMQNGTITEFGTHEDLLTRGGAYAALYNASV